MSHATMTWEAVARPSVPPTVVRATDEHATPGAHVVALAPRWSPRQTRVAGVAFDALDEAELIEVIMSSLGRGVGGWMVNPNVDVLRQIVRSEEVRALVERASLVIADGAPVEWAARLSGQPLPERVPGSSLIWSLAREAARQDRSIFLLGGDPGVAERAAERLAAGAPGLRVAGTHCPPYGFERRREDLAAIDDAIRVAAPDIVFVGLGFPKQERLMNVLAFKYPGTWFIGTGAGITFAAGDVERAPGWVQRGGLEWVFRLSHEPRRLARRYLVHDAPFAVRLLARSAWAGRAARRAHR